MELVGPGDGAVSTAGARPAGSSDYLPPLVRALCDDAAVFPPGLAPLREAVAAHQQYRASWFVGMIGPLVLPASSLAEFQALGQPVPLCLTFPGGTELLPSTLRAADGTVELRAVEIAVPAGVPAAGFVTGIEKAVGGRHVNVAVEVPQDTRRDAVLAALAGSPYRAKFRTGGVRAGLYPGESELASAVLAAVRAGVAFKATAGLHHAVRNTDPETGFEQHGFLNVTLATDAAAAGASEPDLVRLLAERDAARVAERVHALGTERAALARRLFTSFGTCSITDPLNELTGLGLLTQPGTPPGNAPATGAEAGGSVRA
jgi:hypothetical protein